MLYFLCSLISGGASRRVFGSSPGQRHAGGFKGLDMRSPGVSSGTACRVLGESGYHTEFLFPLYEIAGRYYLWKAFLHRNC